MGSFETMYGGHHWRSALDPQVTLGVGRVCFSATRFFTVSSQFAALRFALDVMTRSKKIDYDKLRRRDPDFVAAVEALERGGVER